jgi:hypothetical protein
LAKPTGVLALNRRGLDRGDADEPSTEPLELFD